MEDNLEQKKKKNYSGIISLIAIIFIFVLIIIISNSGVPGKTINITQLETMVRNGEITQVYVQSNGVGLARKSGSEILPDQFPSKADYNFEFISYSSLDFIKEYNDAIRQYQSAETHTPEEDALYAGKTVVSLEEKNPSASIIETIAPYVSIVV